MKEDFSFYLQNLAQKGIQTIEKNVIISYKDGECLAQGTLKTEQAMTQSARLPRKPQWKRKTTSMSYNELLLDLPMDDMENIFGQFDANIKLIQSTLHVSFVARGDNIKILGDEESVKSASDVIGNCSPCPKGA